MRLSGPEAADRAAVLYAPPMLRSLCTIPALATLLLAGCAEPLTGGSKPPDVPRADKPTSSTTNTDPGGTDPGSQTMLDPGSADPGPPEDSQVPDDGAATDPGPPAMTIPVCEVESWSPPACAPGEIAHQENKGGDHVPLTEAIVYEDNPPASGPHRAVWAKWGEYEYLPPERWLGNLEAGGVALLYHPCADVGVKDALRALAKARPDDDGGPFRWVISPHTPLAATVAVVAWEWTYLSHCVDGHEIYGFIDQHYRKAPKDNEAGGAYQSGWIEY